ncbi:MAG: RidA family protein [Burkholderiaceae bacterium]
MTTEIERLHSNKRMSKIVKYGGVVYLCGQTSGGTPFVELQDQAREVLGRIDALLKEAGTDRSRLLTATIYLKSMSDFASMNECWELWLADAPVPARTTVETALAAENLLIEITVCAAA